MRRKRGRKILIFVLLLIVAGVFVYTYYKHEAKAPVVEQARDKNQQLPAQQPDNRNATTTAPATATGTAPSATTKSKEPAPQRGYVSGSYSNGEEGSDGSGIQVLGMNFNGSEFAPTSLNISVNDYIFFKNTGATGFWPISPDHPGFGPSKAVSPGSTYRFQFSEAGTWKITEKNHPNAAATVIVVK